MRIEMMELERMAVNGELIGKYVRDPKFYRSGGRILGRVTKVKSIERDELRSCFGLVISTTHGSELYVEGKVNSDGFGKYIGKTWGPRIYLEKEWRKSCKTCAYGCKRRNRCNLHSDESVVIKDE